jgi:hypothetical protein
MENTYLLALDGDVDFHPEAVRLLVDRMKKNKKVGAACGRIHPIGSGKIYFLIFILLFLKPRSGCLVSKIRICYRSLASKSSRAYLRLCSTSRKSFFHFQ